jgi:hypothetical protein
MFLKKVTLSPQLALCSTLTYQPCAPDDPSAAWYKLNGGERVNFLEIAFDAAPEMVGKPFCIELVAEEGGAVISRMSEQIFDSSKIYPFAKCPRGEIGLVDPEQKLILKAHTILRVRPEHLSLDNTQRYFFRVVSGNFHVNAPSFLMRTKINSIRKTIKNMNQYSHPVLILDASDASEIEAMIHLWKNSQDLEDLLNSNFPFDAPESIADHLFWGYV